MPRPIRPRKIHGLPAFDRFGPKGRRSELEPINMTLEEYETIKLIDSRGFNQEECSQHMDIARTTVQQLYNDARHKLATSLIEGRDLIIEGGNYEVNDSRELGYGRRRGGHGGGRGYGRGPYKR